MAKKKKGKQPMPAPPPAKVRATQAKVEFDPDQLEEIRRVAKSTGRSLTSFIKICILEKMKRLKSGENHS